MEQQASQLNKEAQDWHELYMLERRLRERLEEEVKRLAGNGYGEYRYTPPSEVFQFQDVRECLGIRVGGVTDTFASCASQAIARFVMDTCNAEIKQRASDSAPAVTSSSSEE